MDLSSFSEEFLRRFEKKMAAREKALPASRKAVRSSANAIRAIHRGDLDRAHELMDEAREAVRTARDALADHPDVLFAGFVQDAEKEYAESRLTAALVKGERLPGPDELGVGLPPYLNGMAEAIGEGRRSILDHLRRGDAADGERILDSMEDMYYVLVSMDFPDAITGNLRRTTDAARGIIEKTRGDLAVSLGQRSLREALERHSRRLDERDRR